MPFDAMFPPEADEDWLFDFLAEEIQYWAEALEKDPSLQATMDFETRSACDLKKHGSWVYSLHPTTEAMCLVYKLPGQERKLWHMAHPQHLIGESPPPYDLFAFILAGGLIEAQNAFFERVIWKNVMARRKGWPEINHIQWRCSAAKASAASLPRSLEGAAKAMKLPVEKDMQGHRLMLKMSKPRKPRKAEREEWKAEHGDEPMPILWSEEEDDIYRLWEYCDRDVESEEMLSDSLPDLIPEELEIWQMDQWINERGAKFDIEMATCALKLAKKWKDVLNEELHQLTGVSAGSKRAQVKEWLKENEDLELPDTAATTMEWYIGNVEMSGRARRVCEIVMEVNKTSTRKYQAMIDKAGEDWRVRDLLMYHGAGTGRWAGKGVQIHNFPARDLIVKDFEEAAAAIKSGDLEWCRLLFGDIMKLLSHALRGAIIPEDGYDFMVADYSAIEARCVLWLAGDNKALDVFRSGGDIYCDMATGIYGYPVNKSDHASERQFGKQAILGLGYGMGYITFLLTCRKYGIYFSRAEVARIMGHENLAKYEEWVKDKFTIEDRKPGEQNKRGKNIQARRNIRRLEEEREKPHEVFHELALMKYVVDVYRDRYQDVKAMWYEQEEAAIAAVQKPGSRIPCGKVTWYVEDGWLNCELPSSRCIKYRDPEIKPVKTSWGEVKPALRYMSVDGVTRKWVRTATYGGKIVENITQAVARDIMANAMLVAYKGGKYLTIMSVHDELVSEVKKNEGSIDEFEALMSSLPAWAVGCPITAEADRLTRYKK